MPTTPQPSHVVLRSEAVQEIMGYVPHWLVRWGITVFFFVLLIVVAASWLIRYPDVIKTSLRLTSLNAPKSVDARMTGKLIRLFVRENAKVEKDEVLAYLESTAHHGEVLALAAHLDTLAQLLQQPEISPLLTIVPPAYHRLGELQTHYQTFHQAYAQFLSFQAKGFYSAKKQLLEDERTDLIQLEGNLREQRVLYEEDWQIAQKEFGVQQLLAEQQVIATLDLQRERSRLLAKKLPLKQVESALFQNHSAQIAKQTQLLELDQLMREQRSIFMQALNTFRSSLESWKCQYVLTAPVTGRVLFAHVLEEKQTLTANQEVFFVSPPYNQYFGEVLIPQPNLGKVKLGQTVLIRFEGYPFQEFGTVKGAITYLSEIPTKDSAFLAKVALPAGLLTDYGRTLTYRNSMQATAEVITDDTRLIEKIFYNFRKALHR